MNFMITEQVITLISWIVLCVIIFEIAFEKISDLVFGTVGNILLCMWWRYSCVKHAELLNPAKQQAAAVQMAQNI